MWELIFVGLLIKGICWIVDSGSKAAAQRPYVNQYGTQGKAAYYALKGSNGMREEIVVKSSSYAFEKIPFSEAELTCIEEWCKEKNGNILNEIKYKYFKDTGRDVDQVVLGR